MPVCQRNSGAKHLGTAHVINKSVYRDIFYTSVFQFRDNLEPKFGTLVFSSLHAEDLFYAVNIYTDSEIDSLIDDPAVMTHRE